jgi:hypothetical protein
VNLDEDNQTMLGDLPDAPYPAPTTDSDDAARACECEFCSPEPEPIPAPWERTAAGADLRLSQVTADGTPRSA